MYNQKTANERIGQLFAPEMATLSGKRILSKLHLMDLTRWFRSNVQVRGRMNGRKEGGNDWTWFPTPFLYDENWELESDAVRRIWGYGGRSQVGQGFF